MINAEQRVLDSLDYTMRLVGCESEEEREAVRLEHEIKKLRATKKIAELKQEKRELEGGKKVTESPFKTVLKADYPSFGNDLPILIEKKFLQETDTGYRWLKNKNALAYYFKNMEPTRKRDWAIIERAFSTSGLKNCSRNEYDKKPCDYEELLLFLPPTV